MVPVLNAIGVHCAVYGNHDFGKCHGLFLYTWDHKSKHFDSNIVIIFSYSSFDMYILGAQKRHLIEMVLFSTYNIFFQTHTFICKALLLML